VRAIPLSRRTDRRERSVSSGPRCTGALALKLLHLLRSDCARYPSLPARGPPRAQRQQRTALHRSFGLAPRLIRRRILVVEHHFALLRELLCRERGRHRRPTPAALFFRRGGRDVQRPGDAARHRHLFTFLCQLHAPIGCDFPPIRCPYAKWCFTLFSPAFNCTPVAWQVREVARPRALPNLRRRVEPRRPQRGPGRVDDVWARISRSRMGE